MITAAGGQAVAVRADVADVADPAQLSGLFDAVEDCFGRVDIVARNAGIRHRGLLADATDVDTVFAVATFAVDGGLA